MPLESCDSATVPADRLGLTQGEPPYLPGSLERDPRHASCLGGTQEALLLLAQAALADREARAPLADERAATGHSWQSAWPPVMWPVETMIGKQLGHSKILHRSRRRGRVGKRHQSQF